MGKVKIELTLREYGIGGKEKARFQSGPCAYLSTFLLFYFSPQVIFAAFGDAHFYEVALG